MNGMFYRCESFNQDISKWDVSKVKNNILTFFNCSIENEYKPKFKQIYYKQYMKTLNQYIKEKLIINKDYRDNTIVVKTFDELRKIIEDRYKKLGPGTEQNPIDFNDIDVSNIDSFYYKYKGGIFEKTKFKHIDISDWDVSNIKSMRCMFCRCYILESVGDLSNRNLSNVIDMTGMLYRCESFNHDISK